MTCPGCYKKLQVLIVDGEYGFRNMNIYVHFMQQNFSKWFESFNLKVSEEHDEYGENVTIRP